MKNIKIGIVTLLAVLMSTTLAFAGPGFGRGSGMGMGDGGGMGMGPCGGGGQFAQGDDNTVHLGPGPLALIALNLTDDQQTQLEKLQDEYAAQIATERDKVKELRENLEELAEDDGVKKEQLISLMNQIRDAITGEQNLRQEYRNKLHELLTTEQLVNLVRIRGERFNKRGGRWNR